LRKQKAVGVFSREFNIYPGESDDKENNSGTKLEAERGGEQYQLKLVAAARKVVPQLEVKAA
jgi:hypothetical protein